MVVIPVKQLGKRRSLDHRHRWSEFQCWSTSSRLLLLCPLYCILIQHIRKSNRSQVIAFIAFSFITTRSKRFFFSTSDPKKLGLGVGWPYGFGEEGCPQTEKVSPPGGFPCLRPSLPLLAPPQLQPSTDLTALPQETQESSPPSPPPQVPHPLSTNERSPLSRRRPMRAAEARSSGGRRPPLTCCLCW